MNKEYVHGYRGAIAVTSTAAALPSALRQHLGQLRGKVQLVQLLTLLKLDLPADKRDGAKHGAMADEGSDYRYRRKRRGAVLDEHEHEQQGADGRHRHQMLAFVVLRDRTQLQMSSGDNTDYHANLSRTRSELERRGARRFEWSSS